MENQDIPTPRERHKAGQEPYVLHIESTRGQKKTSYKAYFTNRNLTAIFRPGLGDIPIAWDGNNVTAGPGISGIRIEKKLQDNALWDSSRTILEISIEPEACPVFFNISEETWSCSKDGESFSSRDSYWIEIYKEEQLDLHSGEPAPLCSLPDDPAFIDSSSAGNDTEFGPLRAVMAYEENTALWFLLDDAIIDEALKRLEPAAGEYALNQISRGLEDETTHPLQRDIARRVFHTLCAGRLEPFLGATVGLRSFLFTFQTDRDGLKLEVTHPGLKFAWPIRFPPSQVRILRFGLSNDNKTLAPEDMGKALISMSYQKFSIKNSEFRTLAAWKLWDGSKALTSRYTYGFRNLSIGTTISVTDNENKENIDVTAYNDW